MLDAEVAAGEIGYEDGLIRLLRSFLGDPEVSLPAAYDSVVTREGNSIVERAGDYIAAGADEAAKAEMQRLLDLIVPSTEQLEAYSQPAEVNLGGPGLTRPVAQADCAALWLAGFPLEGVSTYPCFEYTRTEVPGVATYTIYFPAAWVADPTYSPWFERAHAAADESLQVLGRYGAFDDVSIIFSLLPAARASILATTHGYQDDRRETCPILIYPLAFGISEGEFKQIVAHELFHCYQFRNLSGQMTVPNAISDWWVGILGGVLQQRGLPPGRLRVPLDRHLRLQLGDRADLSDELREFRVDAVPGERVGEPGIDPLLRNAADLR